MFGYYEQSLKEWMEGMGVVEPLEETEHVSTEEEAAELEVGTVFLAPNGAWYIVVEKGEYRRWYWGSPLRAA